MARLLVVDDDRDVLEVLEMMLRELGHDVTGAANAERARRRIGRTRYELALIDWKIGADDGLDLAYWLLGRGVRVLMVRASLDRSQLEAAGISWLPKPFVMATLEEAVDRALACGVSGASTRLA
jgi:two-component system response regulator PilR (NtrC family)